MSGSLLRDALAAIEKLQARVDSQESGRREPIAIVGAACRYPGGADDPDGLWRIVRDGLDVVGPRPAGRELPADPDTRGGYLRDIDQFDPRFFAISAREANAMDPQHRLLLETGHEALERAGLPVDRLAGSATGVFVGITLTDYAQLMMAGELDEADQYVANGGALNTAPGRLSFAFGFEGPSIAVDTACSSSLVAVHLAVQSLQSGETNLALAGGVNIILRPILAKLFAGMGMMAADRVCKPFDAAADGFVRSEGCGMIVLRRLSDALAAGDPVLAVIRGSAVNSDGRSSGLTVPHGPSQEALIRTALSRAGLKPDDIDYVEAHGTGTSLGDPIEMEALAAVLARQRPPGRELLVGALKSNIGHAESAAGIAGLLKTVLALQHAQIPPTLHFHTPSPKIAWAEMAVRVPTELTAWPRDDRPRRAGVSGFGFSGTNAHVILEEAPAAAPPVPAPLAPPAPCLVPFSAASEDGLRALAARHADFLAAAPAVSLADYVVTMGQGRAHRPHRLGVIAGSLQELADRLRQFADGTTAAGVATGLARTTRRPKLAFMFTGQGAQYPGMGHGLYQTEPVFRAAIDRCAALLAGRLDRPLTELLFGSGDDPSVLAQTRLTQPAMFAVEYALAELWQAWGVAPQMVVGHSLGEYVAACVAGVFSLEQGLTLVAERGRLMGDLPPGGAMAAIFASETAVAAAMQADPPGSVAVAAVNGPQETVIAGEQDRVAGLCDRLGALGIASRRLDVSHAFHSPLLDPMLDRFEASCAGVAASPPRIPLVSNLTGAAFPPGEAPDARYWRRHAREPVRFAACLNALRGAGVTALLEIGPHPTLLRLAEAAEPDAGWATIHSLRRGRDPGQEMLQARQSLFLAGVNQAWQAAGGRRVALPVTPFQRARYWMAARPAPADAEITRARPEQRPTEEQDRAPAPASIGADHPPARPEAADGMALRSLALRWEPAPEPGGALQDRYVLIGDRRGPAQDLAQALQGEGKAAVLSDDPASLAELVAGQSAMVVDCRALGPAPDDGTTDAVRTVYGRALELVQAVAASGSRAGLCVLTRGAVAAGSADRIELAHAVLPGLIRVAAAELADRPILLGDLGVGEAPGAAIRLLRALSPAQPEAALRQGRVLTPCLAALPGAAASQHALPVRADGTYLVSGGRGGLGLAFAERLSRRGAGCVVLLSRQPPDPKQRETIDRLRAAGGRIEAVACDVADAVSLRELRRRVLAGRPPVRGVLHAAGTLSDAAIADQNPSRFDLCARGKIGGALALHDFTQGDPIELFILFSSAAALFGAPGQGNYAAANSFLDGMAAWRRSLGLPALSVAWGGWQQSGMAGDFSPATVARLERLGFGLMAPDDALDALERVPAAEPLVAIASLDLRRVQRAAHPALAALLRPLAEPQAPPAPSAAAAAANGAAQSHAPAVAPRELLMEEVARVLGIDGASLDLQTPLADLGFDSMMAIHVRHAVMSRLGIDLPFSALLAGQTFEEMAAVLAARLPAQPVAEAAADATAWEVGSL